MNGNYPTVPQHLIDSLYRYANEGYETGGFLKAVLANDLMEAINRADHESLPQLKAICQFIYNELPAPCHGSYAKVAEWLDRDWTRARKLAADAAAEGGGK